MQQLLMRRVVQTLPLVMTGPCFAGLANIAGDGPNARDVVLAAGVMQVVRYSHHFGCVSPPTVVTLSHAPARSPHLSFLLFVSHC
jgi:hypothetical protein